MTRAAHTLWILYAAAVAFTARGAVLSVQQGALWRAAGLAATAVLLAVALGREYVAADEKRAAARRAERAARLRTARTFEAGMRRLADAIALDRACCERWWTSCGTDHDPDTYTRKDTTR